MISTRKAGESDFDLIYRAKKAGYQGYVERIWGKWDERWQKEELRRDLETGRLKVIICDGADAGFLHVLRGADAMQLADIALLPEYRGKGIGTEIIRTLLAEARAGNIPLELGVLRINLEALKLYKELGFVQFSENATHIRMRAE